jgi:hypothetical protein
MDEAAQHFLASAGGPIDEHRDFARRQPFGQRQHRQAFRICGDRRTRRGHAGDQRAECGLTAGVAINQGKTAHTLAIQAGGVLLARRLQRDAGALRRCGRRFVGTPQMHGAVVGHGRDDTHYPVDQRCMVTRGLRREGQPFALRQRFAGHRFGLRVHVFGPLGLTILLGHFWRVNDQGAGNLRPRINP